LLAQEGASVVIADVREEEGENVAKDIGTDKARFIPMDVTRRTEWDRTLKQCEATFGAPSILVLNAGVMVFEPLETTTEAQFRRAFDVNVLGVLLGIQAAMAPMERIGGGAIVVMSSGAGLTGAAGFSVYGPSKAANALLGRTAARELGPRGIRVNVIAPGGIDTDMSNGPEFQNQDRSAWWRHLPIARIGTVDDVASVVLFLVSDESSWITGTVVSVDGGGRS
jgi:3alpha(or 20beta)-hydroxysteroid dehydrogenase